EVPALPQPGDVDVEAAAQVGLVDAAAHQLGAGGGGLRDEQLAEGADDVGAPVTAEDPPRHRLTEQLPEPQHLVAAGELEHVDRRGGGRRRGDGDRRVDLPHGEHDVRVGRVGLGGGDERGGVDTRRAVGLGVVEVADHDAVALVVQGEG